jgi:hypothetical protein
MRSAVVVVDKLRRGDVVFIKGAFFGDTARDDVVGVHLEVGAAVAVVEGQLGRLERAQGAPQAKADEVGRGGPFYVEAVLGAVAEQAVVWVAGDGDEAVLLSCGGGEKDGEGEEAVEGLG